MVKKPDRKKQTAVLARTQEQRKKEKQEKVFETISRFQEEGRSIDFPAIARAAGVSTSYLYKWPQIKEYIQSLRTTDIQQLHALPTEKGEQEELPTEKKEPGPYSFKSLNEAARKRIQELEIEVRELKRLNELYRGHLAEVYELREENERLLTVLKELISPEPTPKAKPLKSSPTPSATTPDTISADIAQAIQEMGVKVGVRLQGEIKKHSPERVKLAIAAFQQYRNNKVVENPGGCLLRMIQDEAEPNVPQEPISPESDEFDCWYAEAIRTGFCIDVPKNLLGNQDGEILVKVRDTKAPGGYQPMRWKEAQSLMIVSLYRVNIIQQSEDNTV